jgi:hypothetical protein
MSVPIHLLPVGVLNLQQDARKNPKRF